VSKSVYTTRSVNSITDLEGGYWYEGDGEWGEIRSVDTSDKEANIVSRAIRYDCVPRDIRQEVYDAYNGDGRVIHPGEETDD